MADSIRETIMKNVQSTLEGITVAAGYANTIQSVQRYRQAGQDVRLAPGALVSEGDEEIDEGPLSGANGLVTKRLTVGVLLYARQEPTDTKSGDEVINSLQADVEKALATTYTRGGKAIDTKEVGNGRLDPEDGVPELNRLLIYELHYRHRREDPTSLT